MNESPDPLAAQVGKDLAYLSVTELLQRFRRGTLSPGEVLEAQIQRIEALNGMVNCITQRHFEDARAAAQESARRYRTGNPRQLEGITIAVKDEFAVEGWTTTMGSYAYEKAAPAAGDDPLIERLREAGAIFHIQTTVPEFYCWITTTTPLWGDTCNPWNLSFSPGGSSGGSGAALAAGFATLALGSDMGGSIRIPASQCGLYGFKPPFGRVPTSEVAYESSGPIARSFADLNLLTRAMAGPHPGVHSSLRPGLDFPSEYPAVEGWRIAYDPGIEITPLDKSVSDAMEAALKPLRDAGVTVERVDVGFCSSDLPDFLAGLFSTGMGGFLAAGKAQADDVEKTESKEVLTPYVRYMIGKFLENAGPGALMAADELLKRYHRKVQEKVFASGFKALIMPTLGTPLIPVRHGMDPERDAVMIGGKPIGQLDLILTWPWNLLSRYPVISAPIGIGPQGMPMGMQIIANTYDDLTAFQLAATYARVAPALFAGNQFPAFQGAGPVKR